MSSHEVQYKGLAISGGVAYAKVCLFNEHRHNKTQALHVEGLEIEREKARFKKAVKVAAERTQALVDQIQAKLGSTQAGIFAAQKMMLQDPELHKSVIERIEKDSVNAEAALTRALDAYETALTAIDNEYLRERATDIGEIKRRLLDVLQNTGPSFKCAGFEHCQQGKNRVIAAVELTPSLTAELEADTVRGIVTEHGGTTSHAAILARALGIPAVAGVPRIHESIGCGTDVVVDGDQGLVIVWPSKETLAKYSLETPGAAVVAPADIEPPVAGFAVMANVSRFKDVEAAVAAGAEGIGLYRTEFGMLVSNRIMSEQEQYEQCARILEMMHPRPVTVRMLDLGGEKGGDWLNLPHEENPQLGLRGSRLLMGRPDLFDPQARALARASAHAPVNVMYPMIVDAAHFIKMREAFEKATADIEQRAVRHGVMFEVPAACLQADEIFRHAEFASIGTNDLTQYLFAVDRNNELVADYYEADAPAFWSLIRIVADAAMKHGRNLAVCGEIAADERFTARFIEHGIRTVSVSTRLIAKTRRAARQPAAL